MEHTDISLKRLMQRNKIFFSYVSLFGDHCDEWGSFSLEELGEYKDLRFGLGIERDLHFGEQLSSEVINKK